MNPITICLLAGGVGVAFLPWYGLDQNFWSLGWLSRFSEADAAPALLQAILHGRLWLWPIILLLVPSLFTIGRPRGDRVAATIAVVCGALGFAWFFLQGFAIGLRGWNLPLLETLFGPVAPQEGAGYGALVAVSAFLLLFTNGVAERGVMKGDAFVVGAIGVVVASIGIFVFFPVATILVRAAGGEAGPSLAAFSARFAISDIWGLGCLAGGRCGVFWNSLALAVVTGVVTTLLGLAFALLGERTNFRQFTGFFQQRFQFVSWFHLPISFSRRRHVYLF